MSNKLKEIFSNQMFDLGGTIKFINQDSYDRFQDALQLVYKDGETVEVDGVSEIDIHIKTGNIVLPSVSNANFSHVIIGPCNEFIPLTVMVGYDERTVVFNRYQTENAVIFETGKNGILFLKLSFPAGTTDVNVTYQLQIENAKHVKDISESLYIALAIIKRLFKSDIDEIDNRLDTDMDFLDNMKKSFQLTGVFFDRLVALEKELNLQFAPSLIQNIEDNVHDVEELFLLLVEKKVIRLNAKFTPTEATGIRLESNITEPEVGKNIDLIFNGECIYSIYGKDIHIYTANLLSNAVITKIQVFNNITNVLYGDADSNPMYISFSGFKTQEEAYQETKKIMSRKLEYTHALTTDEYYKSLRFDTNNIS